MALKGILKQINVSITHNAQADAKADIVPLTAGRGYLSCMSITADSTLAAIDDTNTIRIYLDGEVTASTIITPLRAMGWVSVGAVGETPYRARRKHDATNFIFNSHMVLRIPFDTSIRIEWQTTDSSGGPSVIEGVAELVLE